MNNHPVPAPPPPAPTPAHVGQATAVEQSRAVAEVQAGVILAQQRPRSISEARSEMHASCEHPAMADRAFFRYSRGGSQVTGPSVHLARELARCFHNVQYGIAELHRDDTAGRSEMQAWAWDIQNNTRASTTFIVPHKRDKRGGPVQLFDMRDIYENNANHGARRLREQILAVLPEWFVDEAKERCRATIERGDGKPLSERIDDAVTAFESVGVTGDMIVRKLGRQIANLTAHDLAALRVVYRSISRGEVAVEDEFPPPRHATGGTEGDDSHPQRAPASGQDSSTPAGDPTPGPDPADTTPATTAPETSGESTAADGGEVTAAEIRAAVKAKPGVTVPKLLKQFELVTIDQLVDDQILAMEALHWIEDQ